MNDQKISGHITLKLLGYIPNVVINKASGNLSLEGYIAAKGNWEYISGTMDFSTSSTVSFSYGTVNAIGDPHFDNLRLPTTGTTVLEGNMVVEGNLTTSGVRKVLINGEIEVLGDFVQMNTSIETGGSGKIIFSGVNDQALYGSTNLSNGALPSVEINKASGILCLKDLIKVKNDWIHIQGKVDTCCANTLSLNIIGNNGLVARCGYPELEIQAQVSHISSNGLGSIDLSPQGGLEPYTYTWSSGEITQDLSSLSEGEYTVIVTDADSNTISKNFYVAYYTEWNSLIGLDTPSLGVLKKINNDDFEEVFAGSKNVLGADKDGWFEFRINNPASELGIAFNKSNPENDISLMDFGLFVSGTRIAIMQNNSFLGSFGSVVEGDVLKISREGVFFYVYKNEIIIYSVEGTSEDNLFINVAMEKNGDKLDEFVASFHTKMKINTTVTHIDHKGKGGSVNIEVTGGIAPYSYAWQDFDYPTLYASIGNPNFTLADMTKNPLRTGMEDKTYAVKVSDISGQEQLVYVKVGKAEPVYYTGNIDYIDKKYQKIGPDSWDASGLFSSQFLEQDREGSISLKVNNPEKEFVVGYRDDLSLNVDTNNIDSADLLLGNGANEYYYLHVYSGKINAITQNGSIYLGNVSQNETVFIKREGGVIYFGKNSEVLHQHSLKSSNKMYALLRPYSEGTEVEEIQFIFLDENN